MSLTTPTVLTSNKSTANQSSYTTASITPTAGRLVIAVVTNTGSTSGQPTLSGAGLTWTALGSQGTTRRVTLFQGSGTPSAGALTIDFGSNTAAACTWCVVQYGSDAEAATITNVVSSGWSASTTASAGTLAAMGSGSGVFAAFVVDANRTWTAGTNFTGLDTQRDTAGGELSAFVEWSNTADITADATLSSSASGSGMAIEIAAAAVSGTVVDLTDTQVAAEAFSETLAVATGVSVGLSTSIVATASHPGAVTASIPVPVVFPFPATPSFTAALTDLQGQKLTSARIFGVPLVVVPFGTLWPIQIERAPDSVGMPGTWTTAAIVRCEDAKGALFLDAIPATAPGPYWYRIRHVRSGFADSAPLDPPIKTTPRYVDDTTLPKTLPRVYDLGRTGGQDPLSTDIVGDAIALSAANFLINGAGKTGAVGDAAPSWVHGGGSTLMITSETPRFGSQCLQLVNTSAVDSFSYQEFTLAAGVYQLDGWIKTTALPSTDPGNGACLNVNQISGTGTIQVLERIGDEFTVGEPDVGLLADDTAHDWTYVRSLFRVSVGGVVARIYAQLGHNGGMTGTAWFDGIRLEPGLLNANGSFTAEKQLDPATQQTDGVEKRPLVSGRQEGTGRDGTVIEFDPAFQSAPRSIVWGGTANEPNSANWSNPAAFNAAQRQYPDRRLINVTASHATIRAQLRQPGTPTARALEFSGSSMSTVGSTQALTLTPGAASNDQYTVAFQVAMTLDSKYGTDVTGTLDLAIDTNTGGGWVERATASVSVTTDAITATTTTRNRSVSIAVTGVTSTSQIRIRYVGFGYTGVIRTTASGVLRGQNNALVAGVHGVTYTTSTDITASMTPLASDFVYWKAEV